MPRDHELWLARLGTLGRYSYRAINITSLHSVQNDKPRHDRADDRRTVAKHGDGPLARFQSQVNKDHAQSMSPGEEREEDDNEQENPRQRMVDEVLYLSSIVRSKPGKQKAGHQDQSRHKERGGTQTERER